MGSHNTILDIGCGDGLLCDPLGEFGEWFGIEADRALIDPNSRHREHIFVDTFGPTWTCTRCFSLILMLDVLEHLDEPAIALRRAVELLEPNGVIVITVPALPRLWTTHDDLNHHRERFTKRRLQRVADEAGMCLERCLYFFPSLVPVKLAIRWKERWFSSRPKPPRLCPEPLNTLLYWSYLLEHAVSLRVPALFGTSLLGVGRRREGHDDNGHAANPE